MKDATSNPVMLGVPLTLAIGSEVRNAGIAAGESDIGLAEPSSALWETPACCVQTAASASSSGPKRLLVSKAVDIGVVLV